MDKKRAALVTTAGVGLLISAIFLRKWSMAQKSANENDSSEPVRVSDIVGKNREHIVDPV